MSDRKAQDGKRRRKKIKEEIPTMQRDKAKTKKKSSVTHKVV